MAQLLPSDLDDLRRRIAPHVRRARTVIAFGSVARGEADAWSDLDLLMIAEHGALADLREGAQQLDQYYVPTRYPNGLPGGVPAEVFTRRQADEVVSLARRFLTTARTALP
jgi:hypothetical protein